MTIEIPANELSAQTLEKIYPYAAGLARRGLYREAELWINVALQIAPRSDLCCLLGKIHAQQRRYEDASQSFRRALELDSSNTAARSAIAQSEKRRANSGLPTGPWRPAAATIMLLLAVTAIPFLMIRPAGQGAAPAASSALARLSDGSPAVDPRLLEEYASVIASLKALPATSPLVFTPQPTGSRVKVQVTGSVPSEHIAALIRSAGPGKMSIIDVDASHLQVTHQYVVRPRDTLSSIARVVYGDQEQWRVLWMANRDMIESAHVIYEGSTLKVP